MSDEPLRPDPDRLLQHTAAPHRGKLKVFFGACAGWGNLGDAGGSAAAARPGLDILIGVAETHGRKETAAMLQGLSTLPPRRLAHRGRYVYEFDLDAALARRPALILVDELAHSNAPGSRHPKRWQDVDELLEAGIDVFTTVNVQHLESLNDVVSGITGVQVRETVPDPSLTPRTTWCWWTSPDDLRQRLNEGKVYIGGRARYRKLFPQGQSDCCASWPCAAPPTASMSRCAPGATARPGESLAHPRCDPALYRAQHRQRKAGARRRPARRPPGQRLACGVCRDPFPAPAAGRPAAGYSRRAASGPGAGGRNRHPLRPVGRESGPPLRPRT
ncbi:hypothetical protein M3O75_04540 [Klebsiella pneumoniae]|nr:hypothetical protein [Klebsiella pneumoniae]